MQAKALAATQCAMLKSTATDASLKPGRGSEATATPHAGPSRAASNPKRGLFGEAKAPTSRSAAGAAPGAACTDPAAPLSRSTRSSVWPMRPVTPNIAIPVTRRRRLVDRAGEEFLDALEERGLARLVAAFLQ